MVDSMGCFAPNLKQLQDIHAYTDSFSRREILTIRFSPGFSEVTLEVFEVRCLSCGVGRPVAGLSQGVVIQKGPIQCIHSLQATPEVISQERLWALAPPSPLTPPPPPPSLLSSALLIATYHSVPL